MTRLFGIGIECDVSVPVGEVRLRSEARWTPGSLAEWIGNNLVAYLQAQPVTGSGSFPRVTVHGAQMAQADAVERLTVAARALLDDERMDEAGAKIDDLYAAVEAAERWGR